MASQDEEGEKESSRCWSVHLWRKLGHVIGWLSQARQRPAIQNMFCSDDGRLAMMRGKIRQSWHGGALCDV